MRYRVLAPVIAGLVLAACTGGTSETAGDRGTASPSTPSPTTPTATASPSPTSKDRQARSVQAPETVAVATATGVHLVAAATGERLADFTPADVQGADGFGPLAVGSDGRTVYATVLTGPHRKEIYRVSVEGESSRVDTGSDPAISPDGNKLAYARPVPMPEGEATVRREDLVVRDLGSGDERVWQNAAPTDPGLLADLRSLSWAPDSRHLAFEIGYEDGVEVRILDTTQGESVLDARELQPPERAAFAAPAYRGNTGTLAVVEQRGGVDPAIAPEQFAVVEVDPASGEVLGTLLDVDRKVADADFDPSGQHLVVVTRHTDHDADDAEPNHLLRWQGGRSERVELDAEPLFAAW